jgi:hypothetical protein
MIPWQCRVQRFMIPRFIARLVFYFICVHATARGDANKTYGVDDVIDKYGVVKGSYDEVQLPKIRAFNVMYSKVGRCTLNQVDP